MTGRLFIVSAPSGAGKTTVIRAAVEYLESTYGLEHFITHTTRSPRFDEHDGDAYHFISSADFGLRIKQGYFIEWNTVYGHYYGVSKALALGLSAGRSFIIAVDRAGAKQLISVIGHPVLIWLYTDDVSILEDRLRHRKTEKNFELQKRLKLVQDEIDQERRFPLYHHHICNNEIQITVKKIAKVVCDVLAG